MVNEPFVSIGIISFNGAEYISECIDSCLKQTYQNFEIVIVDDCSTDGSQQIIINYKKLYPEKIKIILHDVNNGLVVNFNSAILASCGDWFKAIACDDILLPNCLELYVAKISKQHINSGFVFAKLIRFDSKNEFLVDPEILNLEKLSTHELQNLILYSNFLSAPTSFLHRKTLMDIGLANTRYPFIEDYPLWLKAINCGVRLYYLNSPTVKYRIHHSLSNSVEKIGHLGYYSSIKDFLKDEIWPRRRGLDRLKSFEERLELMRTIISINLFGNKKTLLYKFSKNLFKVFRFHTMLLRLRVINNGKSK